ncbi:MAG: hypothetical protein N2606_00360 [Candidatus Omnitrophica bacterium]|nr:hypothetical protein [Candidatus Omnitrophota bacterium]
MIKVKFIVIMSILMVGLAGQHAYSVHQDNVCVIMDYLATSVYMAWQEDTGKIWFARSVNRGISFEQEFEVSSGIVGTNRNPKLACDGLGNVYIIWENEDSSGNIDLYFGRMFQGESNFQIGVVPIDNHLGQGTDQIQPAIDASINGEVVIAWVNTGTTGGVFYSRSQNQGESLFNILASQIKRIDDGSQNSWQQPQVKFDSNGTVKYLVWSAEKDGKRNIFANKLSSTDVRQSAVDVVVNDIRTTQINLEPSLATAPASGVMNKVCVLWKGQGQDGDWDILCDTSNDGLTWGIDIQVNEEALEPKEQKDPSVYMDSLGTIYAIWSDFRNNEWDIYYAESFDGGETFKTNVLINADSGTATQERPSIYVSPEGEDLCMVWTDYREGNAKAFFSRSSIFDEENAESFYVDNSTGALVSATTDSELKKATVVVPAHAVDSPFVLTITKVKCPPPNPLATMLNKAVDFGPSGMEFSQDIVIKVPYTLAELTEAGITNPNRLRLYYYNLKTLTWEEVPNSGVDTSNNLVYAPVRHFSIFGIGAVVTTSGVVSLGGGGGGGGGGGCFIATACYGSAEAEDVIALRQFRDQYLMPNSLGKAFVYAYYKFSPPIARYIEKRESLKILVRWALKPIVFLAKEAISW